MPWNPEQYDKFKAERSAPVNDLFSLIQIRPGMRAIDLGCGTGEHTRCLADILPESEVLGIDSSPQMLSKSKQFERKGLSFSLGSFEDFDGKYDLIFSNAALQWSGNHEQLIPSLWEHLNPGGQLAVQMPRNQDHPSHQIAQKLAQTEFAEFFPHKKKPTERFNWILTIERYAEILFSLDGIDIVAFLKVYPHILENSDAIVEWTKGTLLVPFMEQLPKEQQDSFLKRYSELLHVKFPSSPVFYGFKRILFSAKKL
ncbi:MAG: methyltransferase domain-containing protein [Ignavibacteriae bacterium]|nr:methyltransferase domain-containing protein [Ignavibacteriota bacterium]